MRLAVLILLTLSLGACANKTSPFPPQSSEGQVLQTISAEGGSSSAETGPFARLVAKQIAQAVSDEQAGDLRGALESWKVVAALRPEAAEPRERVAALTVYLDREAERHFQRGLESFQAGALEAARREFLLSLINNPDHAGSLEYLKNRIDPVSITYKSTTGETFESIAKKIYSDPSKAVIIARLNDLDPKLPLVPGTTLHIPSSLQVTGKNGEISGAEPSDGGKETESLMPLISAAEVSPVATPEEKKVDAAKQNLIRAQGLFQAHLYPECIALAERLAGHPIFGKKARELVSASWFERGKSYLKEDRFQEAVDSYKKVDPAVRDVKGALAAVEARRREKAEEYYNEGVRLFINQKLEQAVAVWQKTLVLNSAHPKAPRDIEKALVLLEKLKKLK